MSKTRKVKYAFRGTTRQLRLTPEDGIRRLPEERGITKVDIGGNRLVDVVNPETGFCVGVRSAMTTKAHVETPTGVSGGGKLPAYMKNGVWVDEDGRPVRLTIHADGQLPTLPKSQNAPKKTVLKPATGQKLSRVAQGCIEPDVRSPRKPSTRVTKKMVVAYLAEKGYTGTMDANIEKLARMALKAKIAKK